MPLIDDLLESVCEYDCPVKRVCIGLHWTVVQSRFTGMALTFKTGEHHEHESAGDLIGQSAFELAQRLKSDNPLEASLGLAALNSLLEATGRRGGSFEGIFKIAGGANITIVGRFPINQQISQIAQNAYCLEIDPEEGELPASACEDVIPKSDIVIITGTAIINHTMPRLLELSRAAKARTYVLGPSTPMSDVLLAHGADHLGSIRILDPDALINGIMQGMKKFKHLPGIEAIMKP